MSLRTIRIELDEANRFIDAVHRHHKPVQGHRFSVGCEAAGKLVGFAKIQTFVLQTEPGDSLKAAGWICEGVTGKGSWNNRPNRRTDQPREPKMKWSKTLNPPTP